ncbi:MAG TPA: LysM domain-containing protein, partial [Nocardioides sp.]|nr:LysM domain-containing protein [Nocardioides sp.]
MDDATSAVRQRAALLWLVVTAGTAGLVATAGPAVGLLRPDASFADLLVGSCALATIAAAGLLWLATADVAWQQLRTPGAGGRGGRPIGPVRSLLLAACGVAAVAGPAAAVGGDGPTPSLNGLPLPDRATGSPAEQSTDDRVPTVQVRPGDSLWAIAARTLGPDASAADISSYWHRVHALNAAAIGADPDLLHPGQQLRLPPS